LAKGNVLKGHGGCCGTYPVNNVTPSELIGRLNNPSVVKSSVINTDGMLHERYKFLLGGPQQIKPDSNQHISQENHTIQKGKSVVYCSDNTIVPPTVPTTNKCDTLPRRALFRNYFTSILSGAKSSCNVTKNTFVNKNKTIAVQSQSSYISNTSEQCNLQKTTRHSCASCPLPN
jgi:hypothetical protein